MKKEVLFIFVLLIASVITYAYVDGETHECGTDIGECRKGTQTYTNNAWSACIGSIPPVEEICFDNKDNNCNSLTDENCNCIEGSQQECSFLNISYAETSYCKKGIQTCINNVWTNCTGFISPLPSEICNNNVDDNCNSLIDNQEETCKTANITLSCNDRVCNGNEDCTKGLTTQPDCGGSCIPCATCKDGILNQGEEKTKQNIGNETISDCGGPCIPCPTCNDKIKNYDETGIDCGGICKPCITILDSDNDGLLDEQENKIGTNINLKDTDNDGINDNQDLMPLCPNKYCDIFYNETKQNCPEDCGKEIKFNYRVILVVLIPLIVFAGWLMFKKLKKKK